MDLKVDFIIFQFITFIYTILGVTNEQYFNSEPKLIRENGPNGLFDGDEIVIGDNVQFQCEVADSNLLLKYEYNDKPLENSTFYKDIIFHNCTIEIHNTSEIHTGTYKFLVYNESNEKLFEKKVELVVNLVEPPSAAINATQGKNVTVECPVRNSIEFEIVWQKNGISENLTNDNHYEIPPNKRSLKIINVTVEDEGEYICRVSAGGSTSKKSVLLQVSPFVEPSSSSFTTSGTSGTVRSSSLSNSTFAPESFPPLNISTTVGTSNISVPSKSSGASSESSKGTQALLLVASILILAIIITAVLIACKKSNRFGKYNLRIDGEEDETTDGEISLVNTNQRL